MTIALAEGSHDQWGTEYSILTESTTLTPQTDEVYLSAWINFSRLVPGDVYAVTLYETVGGGSMRALETWPVNAAQALLFRLEPFLVGTGYQLTLRRTAGADREIDWGIRTETSSTLSFAEVATTVDTDERSLITDSESLTPQTDLVYLQPWIDPSAMLAGDRYRLRVTDVVNGRPATPVFETELAGAQAKLWTCPIVLVGGGWNVTAQLIAGSARQLRCSARTDDRSGSGTPPVVITNNTTTEEEIRDHIIALIKGLTPTVLEGDRFEPYRNEGSANIRPWAEAAKQGSFRRVQVRDTGEGGPPEITNTDVQALFVIMQIIVCYPQSSRAGRQAALDRDDAKRADQHQIEQAVGLNGYANFTGADNPNASWVDGRSEWEEGDGVDFLVITQRMRFYRRMVPS